MEQPQNGVKRTEGPRLEDASIGRLLIGGSIVISAVFIWASSSRSLSTLENTLLQTFALGIGLAGSFIYGKDSSRHAARELIRPVARSAFRRLVTIYRGLAQLNIDIESARERSAGQPINGAVLDSLRATVVAHTWTALDALADWQDMVPEDVTELRAELASQRTRENQA